jgi:hypothetical protein
LQYLADLEPIGKIINTPAMVRKICSYDRLVVPNDGYILAEPGGDMYFCNARCFSIWSIQWATKPKLTAAQRSGDFLLTAPTGEKRSFQDLSEVARWAAANALGSIDAEWLTSGKAIKKEGE